MINNLEILKPILHFEKDYYVRVIILSRSKDGNLLQKRIGRDLFLELLNLYKEQCQILLQQLQSIMPEFILIQSQKDYLQDF